MNYADFIKSVRQRGVHLSENEAEQITVATLETLGQRLPAGEADDLAAQLPSDIGHFLIQKSPSEKFGIEEFFGRIAGKMGIDRDAVEPGARAVTETIEAAVSADQIEDVLAELPSEFHDLFKPLRASLEVA